jgi:hypothetical protein
MPRASVKNDKTDQNWNEHINQQLGPPNIERRHRWSSVPVKEDQSNQAGKRSDANDLLCRRLGLGCLFVVVHNPQFG